MKPLVGLLPLGRDENLALLGVCGLLAIRLSQALARPPRTGRPPVADAHAARPGSPLRPQTHIFIAVLPLTALLAAGALALTLGDFPSQFLIDTGFQIVVGVEAQTIDTLSAERLQAYLAREEAKWNLTSAPRGLLDAEAFVGAGNYLVVGGPCVNRIAFVLLDKPPRCTDGFAEGKARIELFATGDAYALLLAGYSGVDTQRAVDFVIRYQMPNATRLLINTRTLEILEMG